MLSLHKPVTCHFSESSPLPSVLFLWKGKFVPVCHEGICGKWSYHCIHFQLGTRWGLSGQSYPWLSCFWRKSPGIHWRGGWVDPIATLSNLEKRKSSVPTRIWTPDYPAHGLVNIAPMLSWSLTVSLKLMLISFHQHHGLQVVLSLH